MTAWTQSLPRLKGVDRVWLFIAATFTALLVTQPQQAGQSASFVLNSVSGIAGYLLAAVALTAYVKASDAENLIGRVFQGREATSILIAAGFGVLSPFCSCGVVPMIAALLAMGTPFSAVLAFCLSSPVMSPDAFFVTAGTLGMEMAVAKTLAAIGMGVLGGFGALLVERLGLIGTVARQDAGNGGCSAGRVREARPVTWAIHRDGVRLQTFGKTFTTTGVWLLKWLVLAYLLESLMLKVVPANVVSGALGPDNPFAIPLAALLGIPMYLNGYAALPLVKGFIDLGTTPAVALTFLVAGGVTSLPASLAVLGVMRVRTFAVYLAFSLIGAVLAGVAYGLVLS